MREDADDLVYANEEGGIVGALDPPTSRDERLSSSDDVRAMIDVVFASDESIKLSSGHNDGGGAGKTPKTVGMSVPQAGGVGGKLSVSSQPTTGLGGLGASENVDESSHCRPQSSVDGLWRATSGAAVMGIFEARSYDAAEKSLVKVNGSSVHDRGFSRTGSFGSNYDAMSPSRVVACPKWSDVLKSPSKGESFSPSRDMSRSGNLHGLGLTVAVDRAKSLSRCGKRCADLLADVAALHDVFAQSIMKCCHALRTTNDSNMIPQPVGSMLKEIRRSLMSFAKQMQGLSICIKGSVARPLYGSASAMSDTVPNIHSRYALTRAKAFSARQNAIKMRLKYVKTVRDVEVAVRSLKEARAPDDTADDGSPAPNSGRITPVPLNEEPPADYPYQTNPSVEAIEPSTQDTPKAGWEDVKNRLAKHHLSKFSDKVIKALDDVQLFEANYCKFVSEENNAVSRSQTMEIMALEALQKLEEERLQFFFETLQRVLQAEKGALDNMALTLRKTSEDSVASTVSAASSNASQSPSTPALTTSAPTTPSALFTKRKTPILQPEEGGSSMNEVLALKLPEAVGRLRDTQKRNLSAQLNTTQAMRVMSFFFEEVGSAALSFGSGLQSRLANDGYASKSKIKASDVTTLTLNDFSNISKPSKSLVEALNECEGDRALSCWNKVIESFGECAKSSADLGESVQKDGRKLLDKCLSSERQLKNASEGEEKRWKLCCDSAKDELKANTRLDQSLSELDKARQRLRAAEDDTKSNPGNSTSLKKNSAMTKALGNMFSILPDEAMTMLSVDQRLAIVKRNLGEADTKHKKDMAALQLAQSTKERAISSYLEAAQAADSHSGIEAGSAWSCISVGIEAIVSFFQNFRESRYGCVEPAMSWLQEKGAFIVEDMGEWTKSMEKNIAKHVEKEDDMPQNPSSGGAFRARKMKGLTGKGDDGYSLQVNLEDSKFVYKLLGLEITGFGDVTNGQEELESDIAVESEMPEVKHREPNEQQPESAEILPSTNSIRSIPSTKELSSLAATSKENSDGQASEKKSDPQGNTPQKLSKTESVPVPSSNSADTEVFLAHFWEDNDSGKHGSSPPTVIDSFSCAYWPKEGEGSFSPLLHGRLFITSSAMYFIGWGDKKIVLKWEDALSVTKDSIGMLDNSLRFTYDNGDGESSYFFGSFAFNYRLTAFQITNQLITVARSLKEIEGKKRTKSSRKILKDVPPDEMLKKMEIILSKEIKNVRVKDYYVNCWSEGNKTDAAPFYGPFLEKKKNFDVKISAWEFADPGSEFLNEWSGEKFTQKRVVSFRSKRTTHLYIGPPIAGVTQTQYCRVEGNDKCVLAMTVVMDGIPYADVFAIEVRWVTRRLGNNDVSVDVGVFVDFKKSSMFASKIRSGTVQESKPVYIELFEATKEVCIAGRTDEIEEEKEHEKEEGEGEAAAAKEVCVEAATDGTAFTSFITNFSKRFHPERTWDAFAVKIKATSLMSHDAAVRHILLIVGLFAFIYLCFPFSAKLASEQTGGSGFSQHKLDDLTKRIDDLNGEVKEIKELLHRILSLVESSEQQVKEM